MRSCDWSRVRKIALDLWTIHSGDTYHSSKANCNYVSVSLRHCKSMFCTNLCGMSLGHLRSWGKKDFPKCEPFQTKKKCSSSFIFSFFLSPWVNVTVEKDLSHPVNHLGEARGLNPSYSLAPQTNNPQWIENVILKMCLKVRRGCWFTRNFP